MQLPCFNEYRELFYDLNRKKIVTENIRELLTPLIPPPLRGAPPRGGGGDTV